jgi:carbonic anhydrase
MTIRVRWDLGIGKLSAEWLAIFRREHLRDDLVSALSVALLAIPLALAIALASGVSPQAGLTSAILAGVVAALFGGAPLSVTGPAAAMAVLIMSVIRDHGMGGLLVITIASGALQLATGMLGFGRIARLVPLPVIEGFTAGIGAIIFVGQLPRALGLDPPDESRVLDVIIHITELFHEMHPASVAVAVGAAGLCLIAPRLHKRIPGALLAVIVPSIIVSLLDTDLPRVGTIPRSIAPRWPSFDIAWGEMIAPVFMVFALASLESLLSAAAVDKLSREARHDPDQEFIGQGLANVASGLFGGIPVTGVIARSALNVQAGAKTRRSALLHGVIVFGLMFGAAPLLEQIPLAALAGVLLAIALRMLDPTRLVALYRTSRADAAVYFVTFALMVSVDLIKGVQWGLGAAFVVAAVWSTRHYARLHPAEGSGVHRLVLGGSVTFLSAMNFESLRAQTSKLPPGDAAIIDLTAVVHVDSSGAEYIVDLAKSLVQRGMRVLVVGMSDDVRPRVLSSDEDKIMEPLLVASEGDISTLLDFDGRSDRGRLSHGVAAYRHTQLPRYGKLFRSLAGSQQPHTLFITCADSRLVPNLITDTDPGELFILRNVGNMIPPFSLDGTPAVAGLEYALGILHVSDIVVCGHSGCGAIAALRRPQTVPAQLPNLRLLLDEPSARKLCDRVPIEVGDDEFGRMNTLLQLDNLRSHPLVRDAEARSGIRLRAWFFEIATGELENYDVKSRLWQPIGREHDPLGATVRAS